ncbi:MAG: mechanosensitive ion channel [Clostridia bacterium]|nr:mechanosensitive ion channel [Clostridia bacterium]
MKKSNISRLIRLIVCVIAIVLIIGVGTLTKVVTFDEFKSIEINVSAILKVLVMALAVIAVEALITFLLGLPNPKNHRIRSLLSIISSLTKYIAVIVILCWGLSILGVNISTIVASVGVLALIVGFSAESLIADMITGGFMIFENQYNVGDIVEVDGFRGTVTSIGIRTTCITDLGGNVRIVNNSQMKNILNRSDRVSRSVSNIAIPYGTDLEKLESEIPGLMESMFEAHRDIMVTPPQYLGVQELADSAVVLRFMVDVDEKDIYTGARVLNHDLLLGFRKLGVECPFPQLDVHKL